MNGSTYSQPALTSFERVTSALAACGSQRKGHDLQCPAHDDRSPSLTVKEGIGMALIFCHVCGRDATPQIMKTLGLEMRDLYDNPIPGRLSPVRQQIATLLDTAPRLPWEGRSKETDRDAYVAVLKRGYKANDLTVHYSLRELGQDIKVWYTTAGRALGRDQEKGLIRLASWHQEKDGSKARSIEIIQVSEKGTWSYEAFSFLRIDHVPLADTTGNAELDAMLGKKGVAVLLAVTGEPAMPLSLF